MWLALTYRARKHCELVEHFHHVRARRKAAPENVADLVVVSVVPLRVNAIELAHTGAQVAVNGLHNDMKVVVHQAVGVAQPVMTGTDLAQ